MNKSNKKRLNVRTAFSNIRMFAMPLNFLYNFQCVNHISNIWSFLFLIHSHKMNSIELLQAKCMEHNLHVLLGFMCSLFILRVAYSPDSSYCEDIMQAF